MAMYAATLSDVANITNVFQYKNFDNHGFQNTQIKPVPTDNFSPALIRMELLERKMNELEDKARVEMQNSLNKINETFY